MQNVPLCKRLPIYMLRFDARRKSQAQRERSVLENDREAAGGDARKRTTIEEHDESRNRSKAHFDLLGLAVQRARQRKREADRIVGADRQVFCVNNRLER